MPVLLVSQVFSGRLRRPERLLTPRTAVRPPLSLPGLGRRSWGLSARFWGLAANRASHAETALATFRERTTPVLGPLESSEFPPEGIGDQLRQGQLHGWAGERHDGVPALLDQVGGQQVGLLEGGWRGDSGLGTFRHAAHRRIGRSWGQGLARGGGGVSPPGNPYEHSNTSRNTHEMHV